MQGQSIIPTHPGANLAPIQPLLRLRDGAKETPHYVCDAIKERFRHFMGLEVPTWREMFAVAGLIDNFIQGKQLLTRNPVSGEWHPLRPKSEDASTRLAMNVMQFYETNCVVKWIQSNPDVTVRAGRDTDEAQAAARAASVVVDHYERRFYTRWFSQREVRLALRFGTYIERVRQDDSARGATALREIVEDREVRLGDGYGYCAECERAGGADEFTRGLPPEENEGQPSTVYACPGCGSAAVNVRPPAVGRASSVVGVEEVNLGDLAIELLPMSACRWDLHKRAEDSSWFVYQQRTSLAAVRRLLGRIRVPGDPGTDFGLDLLDRLAYPGQAVSGSGGDNAGKKSGLWKEPVTPAEFFMSPDDYADIKLNGDEETVSGQKLPAGQYLTDVFPDGLVAVGFNQMAMLVGLYDARHREEIVSGVWHMKPLSGAGRGMADTVEVQRRFNTTDGQQVAYWSGGATPALTYFPAAIQGDVTQYLGNPRVNIPVQLERLPQGFKLEDVVRRAFEPATVPAQFLQYTHEILNNLFQLTSHVTDFSGGLPGVENDTATGAQIAAANSNSVFSPFLQIKSDVRQRTAEITVEKFRAHNPEKRWFALKGKYGRQQGVWLAGADLKSDLTYDVTPDSEVPANVFTKRQERVAFYSLFGGFVNYIGMRRQFPREVADLERLWNVQTEGEDFDEVAQLCRRRFEQARSALGAGSFDPGTQAQMVMQLQQAVTTGVAGPEVTAWLFRPAVSAYEPAHDAKAKWWQDLLDTDEGQEAPPALRTVVETMVVLHFALAGQQEGAVAMRAGQSQAAGAAPGAVMSAALQPPQDRKQLTK